MKKRLISIGLPITIMLLLSIIFALLAQVFLDAHIFVFIGISFAFLASIYFTLGRKINEIASLIDASNQRIFDFLKKPYSESYSLYSKMIPFRYLLKSFNIFNVNIDKVFEELARVQSNLEHLEKLSHAKNHTLETMLAISQQTLTSDNNPEFYERILSAAIDVIGSAEKGSILIWDESSKCFRYEACIGYIFDVLKEVTFSTEETLLFINSQGNVAESSIVSDVHQFDKAFLDDQKMSLLKASNGLDIADTLTSPIYIDDKLYAILNIDTTEHRAFANVDIQLIDFFTSQLSIALQNNLLLKETMHLSHYDKLTGAYNRNYFEKLFDQFNHEATKTLKPYAFVLCDLNYLKTINDHYGHQAGDKVLITFASNIQNELEKEDIFARIGGDEFVILLPNIRPEDAQDKLDYIFEKYKDQTIEFNGYKLPISFSYGHSFFPNDSMVYEVLSKIADLRMYEFKSQYKTKHPNYINNHRH